MVCTFALITCHNNQDFHKSILFDLDFTTASNFRRHAQSDKGSSYVPEERGVPRMRRRSEWVFDFFFFL